MGKERFIVFGIFVFLLATFLSASAIENTIPIQLQTVDAAGDIVTGTFKFEINISNSNTCAPVLYSNVTTQTTDSRGIVFYNLEDVDLNFSEQYWFCYYRDGILKQTTKAGRTPYSFTSKNVSAGGIINDSNLNLVGYNVTSSSGLFSWLGSLVDRITKLFVVDIDFTGNINGSGWINTTANVSASYYYGDGSLLTGISTYNATYVAINTTANIQGLLNSTGIYSIPLTINTTANIQNLINSTGIYSTYNATYDNYATNVSRNWTLDVYNNWNTAWLSTYNATYVAINTTANVQGLLNNTNMIFTNLNVTGSYYGDGSKLTGISATSASWNRSGTEVILHHPGDSVNITGNLIVQGNLTVGDITDLNVTRIKYEKDDAQVVTSGTNQIILYDDLVYDDLGEFNSSSQFVATAPGYYLVDASFLFGSKAWTEGQIATLRIYINGAGKRILQRITASTTVAQYMQLHGTDVVYLNVGDYLDVRIYQNTGGDVNSWTDKNYMYLTIHRLRSSITIGNSGGVPYGTISPFYLETCPDGWIPADGTSGTPDLRGIFVRGAGTSGAYNMSNGTRFNQGFGVFQNDSFQAHYHKLYGNDNAPDQDKYGFNDLATSEDSIIDWSGYGWNARTATTAGSAYGTPRVGGETRPASYALTYCMKTSDDSQQTAGLIGTSGNNVYLQNVSKNFGINQTSPTTTFQVGANAFSVNTTSGNVGIGTTTPNTDLRFGDRGAINTEYADSVAASGTMTISTGSTGGGGFMGTLGVWNAQVGNAGNYDTKMYAVMGRGTATTITQIGTKTGGSGMTFTVTCVSNGIMTITQTQAGVSGRITAVWYGALTS